MKRLACCGFALLVISLPGLAARAQEGPAAPVPTSLRAGAVRQDPTESRGAAAAGDFTSGQDTPQASADLLHGRTLYIAHCGRCHGIDGGGGEGPRLAVPELQNAAGLEGLIELIRSGIPGTPMRGLRIVTDDDRRDIAAFVLSLGQLGASLDELPGDPDEGAALYASMDCAACHIIDGVGGTLGPVLTGIGRMRGIEHLRQALIDPGAVLPETIDSAAGSIYLLVTLQTRDGRRITGTRVNEDTFTLQIRDEEDVFHSVRKEDVVSFEKRFGESLMPSYAGTLNEEGINALVAYLATLKGGS